MTMLKFPEREPWEIVRKYTDADGRHKFVRNDGRELLDGSENPWYKFLHVTGENEERYINSGKSERNRRIWNSFAGRGLSNSQRKAIAGEIEIDEEELLPLNKEEIESIGRDFLDPGLHTSEFMELSGLYFSKAIDFSGYYFPIYFNAQNSQFASKAKFYKSYFEGEADFRNTVFYEMSFFTNSHFSKSAYFSNCIFSKEGHFAYVKFSRSAEFEESQFNSGANFKKAKFKRQAMFSLANIKKGATFGDTTFSSFCTFDGAKFLGPLWFDPATFKTYPPRFFGADINSDVKFPTPEKPIENWPSVPIVKGDEEQKKKIRADIDFQKNAYTELRRQMASLYKVDEEQFFYRQEMACQRALEKPSIRWGYAFYDWFSGYGWSVWKPFLWIVMLWTVGFVTYQYALNQIGGNYAGVVEPAVYLSFTSLIPWLSARKNLVDDIYAVAQADGAKGAEYWITYFGMFQTLFGAILLFLLILALRNRFRLR